jgi:hypothetical protein
MSGSIGPLCALWEKGEARIAAKKNISLFKNLDSRFYENDGVCPHYDTVSKGREGFKADILCVRRYAPKKI